MIDPCIGAFCEEYALIKQSAEDKPEFWGDVARTVAQNVAAGGLGYGLGVGTAKGVGGLLKHLQYGMTPQKLELMRHAGGLLGGISGLALMAAYNAAQKRVDEAGERGKQQP